MKIKPLFDWVQIQPEEAETSKSGIILAGEEDRKTEIAEVLAIGDKMKTNLKVGDKILFKGYTVEEVVLEEKLLFFVKELDLIAKV